MSDTNTECDVVDLLCSGIGIEAVARRLVMPPPSVAAIAAKYREALRRETKLQIAPAIHSTVTARFLGDPPVGRSALDKFNG